MQVDPQKSREAHSQIGQQAHRQYAAASNVTATRLPIRCDLRGPHPAEGRSASAGQPFPVMWATPDDYLRRLDGPPHIVTIEPTSSKVVWYFIAALLGVLGWLLVLALLGAL